MIDFATLVLKADSRGLVDGREALDDLGDEAQRTERRVQRSTDAINRGFNSVAKAAGAMIAGFASFEFLSGAVNQARGFDAALGETSTLIQGTAEEMDFLAETSRRFSREFGGEATAQVQAFYQAISAGAGSVQEAAIILEQANRLAIGGATDVTTGVDTLTTAVNAYSQTGLTAAEASDALFVGMRAGKTTVGELGAALGRILPLASSLGVTFQETVGGVSALTTQGIATAEAVTGLRAVLSAVVAPSKQAADMAAALGLEFNGAALRSQGLAGFLDSVVDATGGSQEALATLFGSVEALNAVLAFSGGAGEAFADVMADMANAAGATQEAFEKMNERLSQRLVASLASFRDLSLVIGNVLMTVLVPVLEVAAAGIDLFIENLDRFQSYAAAAAIVIAASFAPAIITATGVLYGFIRGLVLTRAALIRTGIGVFIVLLGEGIYRITEMVGKLGGLGNTLRLFGDVAQEVWDRFSDGVQAALYRGLELWQNFKYTVFTVMQGVVDAAYGGMENVIATFIGAKDAIVAAWELIPGAIGDLVYQGVNAVIQGVEMMINSVLERVNTFISGIEGVINTVSGWIGSDGVTLGRVNPVSLGGVSNPFAGQASEAGQVAADAFSAAFEQQYLSDPPQLFGDMATDAVLLQAQYAELASSFTDLAGRPLTSVQRIRDALAESGEMADSTEDEIRSVAEAIAAINEQTNIMENGGGGSGGGGASKGLPSVLNDLVPEVKKLEGAAGRMQSAFANAMTSIVTGASSAREAISGLLQQAANYFLNAAFSNLFSFIFSANGNAFSNGNVIPFADGGVVGGPTAFPMAGGKTGVMGEAGPEAIMPLKRGADGKLGVAAQQEARRLEVVVTAEEGEMFVPRVRQISGNVAVQVSSQTSQLQKQAFGSTLTEYDQRGTTV